MACWVLAFVASLFAAVADSLVIAPSLTRAKLRPRMQLARAAAEDVEAALLALPSGGSALRVESLVGQLVGEGGLPDPAMSTVIEGDWQLLHTSSSQFDPRNPLGRRSDGSSPGLEGAISAITGGAGIGEASSSPIQRAFTAAFSVVQTIRLATPEQRVEQRVRTPAGADAGVV
jgi:hypothetical protein